MKKDLPTYRPYFFGILVEICHGYFLHLILIAFSFQSMVINVSFKTVTELTAMKVAALCANQDTIYTTRTVMNVPLTVKNVLVHHDAAAVRKENTGVSVNTRAETRAQTVSVPLSVHLVYRGDTGPRATYTARWVVKIYCAIKHTALARRDVVMAII